MCLCSIWYDNIQEHLLTLKIDCIFRLFVFNLNTIFYSLARDFLVNRSSKRRQANRFCSCRTMSTCCCKMCKNLTDINWLLWQNLEKSWKSISSKWTGTCLGWKLKNWRDGEKWSVQEVYRENLKSSLYKLVLLVLFVLVLIIDRHYPGHDTRQEHTLFIKHFRVFAKHGSSTVCVWTVCLGVASNSELVRTFLPEACWTATWSAVFTVHTQQQDVALSHLGLLVANWKKIEITTDPVLLSGEFSITTSITTSTTSNITQKSRSLNFVSYQVLTSEFYFLNQSFAIDKISENCLGTHTAFLATFRTPVNLLLVWCVPFIGMQAGGTWSFPRHRKLVEQSWQPLKWQTAHRSFAARTGDLELTNDLAKVSELTEFSIYLHRERCAVISLLRFQRHPFSLFVFAEFLHFYLLSFYFFGFSLIAKRIV